MRYKKKATEFVTAVQIDLDLVGGEIRYNKWDAEQVAKQGDWLVNNDGEVYTIDSESFAKTYEERSPGVYCKSACIYAKVATEAGSVPTKEGRTAYEPGDYLVSNDDSWSDKYAIGKDKFESMYEPA